MMVMWPKSRLRAIEDSFARLAARQYVAEAIFATAVALVLRGIDGGLRDTIMLKLRGGCRKQPIVVYLKPNTI